MSNALTQQQRGAMYTERMALVKRAGPTLTPALMAAGLDWEAFQAEVGLTLAANEKLLKSTPTSLMQAITKCARLGLVPGGDLNEVHLVPFWSSKDKAFRVNTIIGYNGLINLACRAGLAEGFESWVIRENDHFWHKRTHRGLEFEHEEIRSGDRGAIIAAAAVARLSGGGTVPFLMFWEGDDGLARIQADAIAKGKSQGANEADLPWVKYLGPQCEKTAIRRLTKRLARSARDKRLWALVERHSREEEVGDVVDGSFVRSEEVEPSEPETREPERKQRSLKAASQVSHSITDPNAEPPEHVVLPGQNREEGSE